MSSSHPMNTAMKAKCKILGVICLLMIFTFPVAFWFFSMAKRSRIDVDAEGLSVKWAGKKRIAFADVESAAIVGMYGPDRASPLGGPLVVILKSGKRHQLPVNLAEDPLTLVRAVEQGTGLSILDESAMRASVVA